MAGEAGAGRSRIEMVGRGLALGLRLQTLVQGKAKHGQSMQSDHMQVRAFAVCGWQLPAAELIPVITKS